MPQPEPWHPREQAHYVDCHSRNLGIQNVDCIALLLCEDAFTSWAIELLSWTSSFFGYNLEVVDITKTKNDHMYGRIMFLFCQFVKVLGRGHQEYRPVCTPTVNSQDCARQQWRCVTHGQQYNYTRRQWHELRPTGDQLRHELHLNDVFSRPEYAFFRPGITTKILLAHFFSCFSTGWNVTLALFVYMLSCCPSACQKISNNVTVFCFHECSCIAEPFFSNISAPS